MWYGSSTQLQTCRFLKRASNPSNIAFPQNVLARHFCLSFCINPKSFEKRRLISRGNPENVQNKQYNLEALPVTPSHEMSTASVCRIIRQHRKIFKLTASKLNTAVSNGKCPHTKHTRHMTSGTVFWHNVLCPLTRYEILIGC